MHCDSKTMIKAAVVVAVAIAVAYFALPEARAFVMASAPILLALICPIAMVAMFFKIKGGKQDSRALPERNEGKPSNVTHG